MVGDGHAMGVAAEILQHILGATEGTSQVDDPVLSKQWPEPSSEDLGFGEELQVFGEAELPILEACGQKTRTTLKWRLKILHRLPLRMDFSDPQAAPTISLSRSYRIQGNLRCFGRACSPMSPE